jgi:hypothetical protein
MQDLWKFCKKIELSTFSTQPFDKIFSQVATGSSRFLSFNDLKKIYFSHGTKTAILHVPCPF